MNTNLLNSVALLSRRGLWAVALAGCATTSATSTLETLQRENGLTSASLAAQSPGTSSLKPSTDDQAQPSPGRPRLPDRKAAFVRRTDESAPSSVEGLIAAAGPDDMVRRVAGETEPAAEPRTPLRGSKSTLSERLKIPEALPGADAPPLVLPRADVDEPELRMRGIDALFPPLPAVTSDIRTEPAPAEPRYSLADLERIALDNNPKITQAAADVDAALGNAVQSGAYPNPTIGYEADTVGSAGTRNYQGMFFTQDIITAGKLDLARSIANVDLMNRQLALRKARAELLQDVRTWYFNALIARESLKYNEALVKFTNEVFLIQVEQLKGGQAAAYEPAYLRTLAVQTRGQFVQSENNYKAAWKHLAASLGEPNLPAAALEGDVALSGQPIDYEAALAYMLSHHTEVLGARNLEFQARLNVRLAEVTPIPDVKVYSAIQRDFTTPPVGRTTYNLQVGVPVPVFNQNRGGIQKARGELVRASNELGRVRIDLAAQLADAFARYENNRILLDYYRNQILPDQARVYRGIYERHQQATDQVGFGDIIVAQQNLLAFIANYVAAMDAQWDAFAEIAGLLQLEDLSQLPLAQPAVPAPAAPGVEEEAVNP